MNNTAIRRIGAPLALTFALLGLPALAQTNDTTSPLSLEQAEQLALTNEPGVLGQQYQARARMEQAVADGQKMDPKLSLGLLNLPTDTFDFDQEAMTQLKVSYMQQFPSGDSLEIKQRLTQRRSQLANIDASLRQLDILRELRLAFLETLYQEQARDTIQRNIHLFEQLVDIVQSLFSVGRNNQQDLIRAQLGVSRLHDRLRKIDQQINEQRSKLARWIGSDNSHRPLAGDAPVLATARALLEDDDNEQLFLNHPRVRQFDQQLKIARDNIRLAEEALKPGYALNISYAYRDDAPNGQDRADFVSAAVTFDLPLFRENRQDRRRQAREHEYQALKNQRLDAIRQLLADYRQQQRDAQLLGQRQQLYRDDLLPRSAQQSDASLLAYQSDRGGFSEVIQAYMDDLNARLDERRIAIDRLKTRARLLYLLPTDATQQ